MDHKEDTNRTRTSNSEREEKDQKRSGSDQISKKRSHSRQSPSSSTHKRLRGQEYFKQISRQIQKGIDDSCKEDIAESILKQTLNSVVFVTTCKDASISIKWLIEDTKDSTIIKSLSKWLTSDKISLKLVDNSSATDVIQALIEASSKILVKESTAKPPFQLHSTWAVDYICSLAEFIIKNMDSLLNNLNGVQVMTTLMEVIGGVKVGRRWSRKTMGFAMKYDINTEIEKDIVMKRLPDEFRNLLKQFSKELVLNRTDIDLKSIILSNATSMIQYLLFVLKVRLPEVCQGVVKRLIEVIFANNLNKYAITTNVTSAYLVEAIIMVSTDHRLRRIWENHLKGSLKTMWKNNIANFIVQRLIDAASNEDLLEDICKEILPHLESIFSYHRPGIAVCLAKACKKYRHLQPKFIEVLMKAFHCREPKERQIHLVPLMLLPNTTHKCTNNVWLHGSLILQYIFDYKDPYEVTESLLSLEQNELLLICNDKSGSYAIRSFLQSRTVSSRHKERLHVKMRGQYRKLAGECGSRIIDTMLDIVDLNQILEIMNELGVNESQLKNSRNGSYVSTNFGLFKFTNDKWWKLMNTMRRRRSFTEVNNDQKQKEIKRYTNCRHH